jgi:hypothetical protein
MPINPKDYAPKLNDWFAGSGTYSGIASLAVSGVEQVRGQATVSWNDIGETSISMNLAADKIGLAHSLIEAEQISVRLETTDGGVFSAESAFAHNNQMHFGASGASATIHLAAAKSEFQAATGEIPLYWVVPVVNLVADFRFSTPETTRHPLRLFPTPEVPDGLEGNDQFVAKITTCQKDKLIPFTYDNRAAFIEPLPDYEEKVKSLEEGISQRHATSIVVGKIPVGASCDIAAVVSWLPSDIFYALAVATGVHVGSGFVELRTADNKLAKRLHLSTHCPNFKKGDKAVDDIACASGKSAQAEFIECVVARFPTKKYLRSVANLIVAASKESMIEDAADGYIRALEALTKSAKVHRQDLLAGIPSAVATNVRNVLITAATAIKAEAMTAHGAGDTVSFDRLSRISDRTRSASQVENMFGLSVMALLSLKGLNDEVILNQFLGAKNPPTTWAQFLSKLRGAVIHEGMIDIPTREELFEVHALLRHLGDVVLRLLAQDIGYSGKYLPKVAVWARDARQLDWVTAATTPRDLRLE